MSISTTTLFRATRLSAVAAATITLAAACTGSGSTNAAGSPSTAASRATGSGSGSTICRGGDGKGADQDCLRAVVAALNDQLSARAATQPVTVPAYKDVISSTLTRQRVGRPVTYTEIGTSNQDPVVIEPVHFTLTVGNATGTYWACLPSPVVGTENCPTFQTSGGPSPSS